MTFSLASSEKAFSLNDKLLYIFSIIFFTCILLWTLHVYKEIRTYGAFIEPQLLRVQRRLVVSLIVVFSFRILWFGEELYIWGIAYKEDDPLGFVLNRVGLLASYLALSGYVSFLFKLTASGVQVGSQRNKLKILHLLFRTLDITVASLVVIFTVTSLVSATYKITFQNLSTALVAVSALILAPLFVVGGLLLTRQMEHSMDASSARKLSFKLRVHVYLLAFVSVARSIGLGYYLVYDTYLPELLWVVMTFYIPDVLGGCLMLMRMREIGRAQTQRMGLMRSEMS
eukprot:gnl/Dysnectes_brevis/6098_a9196_451.p1 GENE.gnl/Dysnectes_brevis/6098_a9196_451~~gnl/Dysnectes_brevis/6098_a9196_451.p1  ORF type:complete len:285 (-),score=10.97 gnl/Dysnectes_brevis/6098_a9196_451:105-959(-)